MSPATFVQIWPGHWLERLPRVPVMAATRDASTTPRRPLDYDELEERTGILKATLRAYVNRKQIPYMRFGPRLVRFDPDAIERWMLERSVPVGGLPTKKRR